MSTTGYSSAANGRDRYSPGSRAGSRARLSAAGPQEDPFASHAVLNTSVFNRDAPPGQDGQDLAAGLGDSPNSQDSSIRTRKSTTSLSPLSSPPILASRIASRAPATLVRPKTHIGALDNQQNGQGPFGSSRLDSSMSKALRRVGPPPAPQSSVPGGQGPLLQVQNDTDRPQKLPAANSFASDPSRTGLQQRIVSATEALIHCARAAGVSLNAAPQSLQAHFSLPGTVPRSEEMRSRSEELRPAVLSTGLGLLVAALVMCATLSFWQHCASSMQSMLFVAPFAAKLWSRRGSEKWQPSAAQKQASVEDHRYDGLWQHAARLSLRV